MIQLLLSAVCTCHFGSTVNASPFVVNGEAFFLNSPSDYVRLSLSAQRVVKPTCVVDVCEDETLKIQLEPDTAEASSPEPVADQDQVEAAAADRFGV